MQGLFIPEFAILTLAKPESSVPKISKAKVVLRISWKSEGTTLYSGIDIGPTFINFGKKIPGPTALLMALRLLIFGIFSRPYRYFQVFHPKIKLLSVKSLHLFFLAKFSGPKFILFAKCSRPYVYSLPYIYSGV